MSSVLSDTFILDKYGLFDIGWVKLYIKFSKSFFVTKVSNVPIVFLKLL